MSDIQIIEPETVVHAKKAKERARQLERRGIARELLPSIIASATRKSESVRDALDLADLLIDATRVDE